MEVRPRDVYDKNACSVYLCGSFFSRLDDKQNEDEKVTDALAHTAMKKDEGNRC